MGKTDSRRLRAKKKAADAARREARDQRAGTGLICLVGTAFFIPLLIITGPATDRGGT